MPALDIALSQGDSLVHRLDPRSRIIGISAFSLPMAMTKSPSVALLGLAFSALLLALARQPASLILQRLATFNLFTFFLWIFVPINTPGQALFTLGSFIYTHEGNALVILITLKTNAAFLAVTTLLGSIAPQKLGCALQALGLPKKICHLLLMTNSYIYVSRYEYLRLLASARARGFTPGTNSHTYRTYAWLFGMLFVKSWDQAERVHQAMLCRGFKGKFYSMSDLRYQTVDALFLSSTFLASAIMLYIGRAS